MRAVIIRQIIWEKQHNRVLYMGERDRADGAVVAKKKEKKDVNVLTGGRHCLYVFLFFSSCHAAAHIILFMCNR